MPVPPRQPSRENMEALFNNALSSNLASRRGGGGGDQHPETTTTTSGDVIQLEPNTNREITFRVWCHGSCARFTCASTLDEEHLPPTCPACGESEFLELVPFRETVEEHGLFSEGACGRNTTARHAAYLRRHPRGNHHLHSIGCE